MKKPLLLILICVLAVQCRKSKFSTPVIQITTEKTYGILADSAMVVSARTEASEIGVAIMKQGGNAFDAMVATDLALLVSFPFAGNIGGGGFMVYRLNDGKTGSIDYREKAPMAASRDM